MDQELDPSIAQKHKEMLDDLENAIDGLESDDEEEKQPPPKKQQPVKKVAKPAAPTKKNDDFGMGNDDMFGDLGKELKKGGNDDIAALEKELEGIDSDDLGLDDDDQDDDIKGLENEMIAEEKSQKKTVEIKREDKMIPEDTSTKASTVKTSSNLTTTTSETKTSQVKSTVKVSKYPLNHFTGSTPDRLIKIDGALHGKNSLQTLLLLENELKTVIEPALESPEVDGTIKKYLEQKKQSLEKFKSNMVSMFKSQKLNKAKYLQIIQQIKAENQKTAKSLEAQSNAAQELERVNKRLKIIEDEEKKFSGGGTGGGSTASTTQSTVKTQESSKIPMPQTADDKLPNIKSTESAEGLSSSGFLKNYDSLLTEELLDIVKKRKLQTWNLANFLNKKIMAHVDDNEKNKLRKDLQGYIQLIQTADNYVQQLEADDVPSDISNFLKKQLVDITPEHLHGKSLDQRSQDIKVYIQKIEECIEQESEYLSKLKSSVDESQVSGSVAKKIKDSEKLLETYDKYIQFLTRLDSEKNAWVPTPKIKIIKDQRQMSLLNKDIPPNMMVVSFKSLHNIKNRAYWIRWTVETPDGTKTYETPWCDSSSLVFDHQQKVKMSNRDKMDTTIEAKQINFQVLFKKVMVFEKKKAEGTISLAEFRRTNTIENRQKIRDDGIEVKYSIKIREPLLRHSKKEVLQVSDFIVIDAFNRNEKPPQMNNSAPQQKTNASSVNPKPKPVEEQKTQSQVTKPQGGGGGDIFGQKKKYPALVFLVPKNDPLANIKQEDLPEGVPLDYALNPTNPDKIECMKVLQELSKILEASRASLAAEGRRAENRIVADNWSKALKASTILQNKIENGELDIEEYFNNLEQAVAMDMKLLKFYHDRGDQDRTAFIAEKIKLTKSEVEEIKQGMAEEEG